MFKKTAELLYEGTPNCEHSQICILIVQPYKIFEELDDKDWLPFLVVKVMRSRRMMFAWDIIRGANILTLCNFALH